MKILLLGGTGAMGSHLSGLLAQESDNEVYVTTRSRRNDGERLHYLQGNAHDGAFLETLLKQRWDAIVDFMVYNTDEFRARSAKLLDGTAQYVYLSSSRVYADSAKPITEDSPRLLDATGDKEYLRTDEYALTKARQENILRQSGRNNWTIIRPYITYGEDRFQLGVLEHSQWLYRALQGRKIVFSKDIADHTTTLTYGHDVARGIKAIIGHPKALGEAFHITCRQSMRWCDLLAIYQDVIEEQTGRRPEVKMIDTCPNLKLKTAQYQVRYDRYYDRVFDSSKIARFVDVGGFLSPEEGIRKALTTFITTHKPETLPIDLQHEATYDRLSGEHTPLRYFGSTKEKIKYTVFRYAPFLHPIWKKLRNKRIR